MPSFYPLLRAYCFKQPLMLTVHTIQRSTVQKSRAGDNAETDAPHPGTLRFEDDEKAEWYFGKKDRKAVMLSILICSTSS